MIFEWVLDGLIECNRTVSLLCVHDDPLRPQDVRPESRRRSIEKERQKESGRRSEREPAERGPERGRGPEHGS